MEHSKYAEGPWGGNTMIDDRALLLSGDGTRCKGDGCDKVTKNCFLEEGLCPDCYQKEFGKQSPALARRKEELRRASIGRACGEAGEAD